jgi:hypothetical protein
MMMVWPSYRGSGCEANIYINERSADPKGPQAPHENNDSLLFLFFFPIPPLLNCLPFVDPTVSYLHFSFHLRHFYPVSHLFSHQHLHPLPRFIPSSTKIKVTETEKRRKSTIDINPHGAGSAGQTRPSFDHHHLKPC